MGSKLVIGKVIEAVLDKEGSICGVKLEDGSIIDADALIVAIGPWTEAARSWFGPKVEARIPKMMGVKVKEFMSFFCPNKIPFLICLQYHSILIQSPRVLNQAVFFSGQGDPEVYPRLDGDAYITGFPDAAIKVTESPGSEEVRPEMVNRLIDATKKTSSELGDIPPHTEQSCYLPTTDDGIPIIGEIPEVKGAFIAAGHGCWGILNGPATGEAVAGLLIDGKSEHVSLQNFGLNSPYR